MVQRPPAQTHDNPQFRCRSPTWGGSHSKPVTTFINEAYLFFGKGWIHSKCAANIFTLDLYILKISCQSRNVLNGKSNAFQMNTESFLHTHKRGESPSQHNVHESQHETDEVWKQAREKAQIKGDFPIVDALGQWAPGKQQTYLLSSSTDPRNDSNEKKKKSAAPTESYCRALRSCWLPFGKLWLWI